MYKVKKFGVFALALGMFASACSSDDKSTAVDQTAGQTATTVPGTTGETAATVASVADTAGEAATTVAAPTGKPIVIGMVLSTSGPAATLGEFQARGVELAVNQLNDQGGVDGRPVELIKRDDQSDPEHAVAETRSLLDEKVDAIVGSGVTGTCYAMEPIVREAQIPTYCLSGAPQPPDDKFMFFALPPLSAFATAQFPWMKSKGYETLALLHATDGTGTLLGGKLPALAEAAGVKLVGNEQFDLTAQDVTVQLTKLRDSHADVLYIGETGGGPAATVLRGLRDIGWEVPVVLTWSNATDAFLKTVGPVAAKETYIGGTDLYVAADLSVDDPGKQRIDAFLSLYGSKYDDAHDMYSASGYDAVNILAAAIAATDGSGAAVRSYMIGDMGAYPGVTGTIDFTEEDLRGISGDSVILMQVTPDGYKRVGG
jgi:branched-chain amino acid transport system substrate-binding protein